MFPTGTAGGRDIAMIRFKSGVAPPNDRYISNCGRDTVKLSRP